MRSLLSITIVLATLAAPLHAEVRLVSGGKPEAVVVTAAPPGSVAAYAAEELVAHVRKATGATLPVVTEDAIPARPAGRVYVGDCKAARAAGIDAARPPRSSWATWTGRCRRGCSCAACAPAWGAGTTRWASRGRG